MNYRCVWIYFIGLSNGSLDFPITRRSGGTVIFVFKENEILLDEHAHGSFTVQGIVTRLTQRIGGMKRVFKTTGTVRSMGKKGDALVSSYKKEDLLWRRMIEWFARPYYSENLGAKCHVARDSFQFFQFVTRFWRNKFLFACQLLSSHSETYENAWKFV